MRSMLKLLILVALNLFYLSSKAQWETLTIPTTATNRYDDIYFINDSLGWAASGETGGIYRTLDAGDTWEKQFEDTAHYLRSITFASSSLGFCGSLDSTLYRTNDSGKTWVDITAAISPRPMGICGLSAPSPSVIYGCGKWTSPAFMVKSVDGGDNWTFIDLSVYATTLVDVHFKNDLEGFVVGKASPTGNGGVVLRTIDGGDTWSTVMTTNFNDDVVWKIQTPDGLHFYGSIESQPAANNVRYIYSNDGGIQWTMDTVQNGYNYIQMIGFLDSLHGWIGGSLLLMETKNGGLSWDTVPFSGSRYNRFFKVNDSTAYITGNKVYRYNKQLTFSGRGGNEKKETIHQLNVFPNPASTAINIQLSMHHPTYGQLELYSENGSLVRTIFDGNIQKGDQSFALKLPENLGQLFYVILKTNEEMLFVKVVKI